MGLKYQIQVLLDNARNFLQDYFCTDFDKWSAHDKLVPAGWEPMHAIGVVNLARLLECPSVLPIALAVCCTLGGSVVIGYERRDGTWETLSSADVERCVCASQELARGTTATFCHALVMSESDQLCAGCPDPKACAGKMRRLLVSYASGAQERDLFGDKHPFRDVRYYFGVRLNNSGVCTECKVLVKERFVAKQKELWDRLPGMMGVTV